MINEIKNIESIEKRHNNLKKDGKYNMDFLRVIGSTKFFQMSDDMLKKVDSYLTSKGY